MKTALKLNHCIVESTPLNHQDQIKLDLIVNTHPDNDHCGGINELFLDEKLTVCCPIITTLAARLQKQPNDEYEEGEEYDSAEGDCPRFWFPIAPGQKHTLGHLPKESTVQIVVNKKYIENKESNATTTVQNKENKKSKNKKIDCNATSILTTVQIPGSKYDYDVVLTGDSYGGIILDRLELRRPEGTTRKNVGIFQVPHHGSKENSTVKSTKGRCSIQKCKELYMLFDVDIYLISHGDHGGYNHPHSDVITGILAAAVEKKHDCNIVVTATWFDGTKIIEANARNWSDYVKIYYFTPYVTLDLKDVNFKLHEGLQLYNEKVHTRVKKFI